MINANVYFLIFSGFGYRFYQNKRRIRTNRINVIAHRRFIETNAVAYDALRKQDARRSTIERCEADTVTLLDYVAIVVGIVMLQDICSSRRP